MKTVKTTSESELRALVSQGKNFKEISAMLGIPHPRLLTTACALGIKSPYRPGGELKGFAANKYLELLRSGMTLQEMADAAGVSRQAVHLSLRRAGYPTTLRELRRKEVARDTAAALSEAFA